MQTPTPVHRLLIAGSACCQKRFIYQLLTLFKISIKPSNVIKIDHKCDKTVKYYPNRIYSKKRRPKFRSDKNKHRGALSKIKNNIRCV